MSHEKKEKSPPGFDRTLRTMEHHGHYHRKFLRGKYRRKQLNDEDTSPNHSEYSETSFKIEESNADIENGTPTLSKSTESHMNRLDRGNNAFTSHKVFIELEELDEDSQDMEWKETARWIKFEEDVNKLKGGFDKPHVSTLSFHSLSDVKKGIQTGCVLLDLEATSLTHVSFQVVNNLIAQGKLDKSNREDVLKALLLRHHHEHHHSFWDDLKNTLHMHHHHHGRQHLQSQSSTDTPLDNKHHGHFRLRSRTLSISIDEMPPEMDLSKYTPELERAISINEDTESHHSLLLDDNTEATAVLVGPLQSLEEPILAFVRLKEARKLGNLLEVNLPVRFLFLLLGPMNCSLNYHEIGRSIATLMSNQDFHDALYAMTTESELLKAIDSFLDESIVVPPGDWNFTEAVKKDPDTSDVPDSIIYAETYLDKPSLIPFKGLFRDFKNAFHPIRYWSDYWEGFNNFQCILVVCFVFFACLGPTLVFGGLYDEKTNHQIGEIESLLASLVFGIIFSIFSGQPLMILGVSGPLLIFDEIIFEFSHQLDIHFLTFRVWIGMWLASFLLIVVAIQGSFLVRYFTRFSEEIIASLTVVIFLIETIFYIQHLIKCYPIEAYCPSSVSIHNNSSNISSNFHRQQSLYSNYSNSSGNHSSTECHYTGVVPCDSKLLVSNTALFSILLIFGTFWLLLTLRRFRHSKFLRKAIRNVFSDFGILISLAIFTIISFLLRGVIYVETVGFPETFEPTTKRSWFINPFGEEMEAKPWVGFLACIPASILCILIIMETQLTSLLIAKKHHRLKKPVGFHLDLLLVAFFSAVSGFFGFPWFCGVAVRSLQHIQALAMYSHESPGVSTHIIGIREQRVTNLFIHILIGVCIPILWAAKLHLNFSLPLPVLFGGLIYLGFISWKSLQFAVRLRLIFMPSKHHPNACYVKDVRPSRMHCFTIIQFICFGIILAVKLVTWTALLFPILCLLLVPFRKIFQLLKLFKQGELEALDHEDDCPKDLGENDENLSEFEITHIPI